MPIRQEHRSHVILAFVLRRERESDAPRKRELIEEVGVDAKRHAVGVDVGRRTRERDAVTCDRRGNKRLINFSTEILYGGKPIFTDGDVLRFGNGVIFTNLDLIQGFEPKAEFLGLDALSMKVRP